MVRASLPVWSVLCLLLLASVLRAQSSSQVRIIASPSSTTPALLEATRNLHIALTIDRSASGNATFRFDPSNVLGGASRDCIILSSDAASTPTSFLEQVRRTASTGVSLSATSTANAVLAANLTDSYRWPPMRGGVPVDSETVTVQFLPTCFDGIVGVTPGAPVGATSFVIRSFSPSPAPPPSLSPPSPSPPLSAPSDSRIGAVAPATVAAGLWFASAGALASAMALGHGSLAPMPGRTRVALLLTRCRRKTPVGLSTEVSEADEALQTLAAPVSFPLEAQDANTQIATNAILGNTVFWVAVLCLHFVVSLAWATMSNSTFTAAAAMLRFPSLSIAFVSLFAGAEVTGGCIQLLRRTSGTGIVSACTLGLIAWNGVLPLVVVFLLFGFGGRPFPTRALRIGARGGDLRSLLFGDSRWVPLPAAFAAGGSQQPSPRWWFGDCWSGFFGGYVVDRKWFLLVDLFVVMVSGAIEGIATMGDSACFAANVVFVVVLGLYLVAIFALTPLRGGLIVMLPVVGAMALQLAVPIAFLADGYRDDIPSTFAVASLFTVLGGGVLALLALAVAPDVHAPWVLSRFARGFVLGAGRGPARVAPLSMVEGDGFVGQRTNPRRRRKGRARNGDARRQSDSAFLWEEPAPFVPARNPLATDAPPEMRPSSKRDERQRHGWGSPEGTAPTFVSHRGIPIPIDPSL